MAIIWTFVKSRYLFCLGWSAIDPDEGRESEKRDPASPDGTLFCDVLELIAVSINFVHEEHPLQL